MENPKQRVLQIIFDQRSVSDSTIALQVADQLNEQEVAALTSRLEQQGLIAEQAFSAGRWHITEAGEAAVAKIESSGG